MQLSVPYAHGTLTATGFDNHGASVANASTSSWGAPAAVVLSVDAPSPSSGTGSKVYLDGQVWVRVT